MKKKKTLRSRFEDNYTVVTEPADNKKGYTFQYVYYAPWYVWQVSEDVFRRKKRLLAALEVFGLVLFLATVLVRSPINSSRYVFLPTALAFCAQLMEFAGVVDFLSSKVKTTQIQYEDIQRRLVFYPTVRGSTMALATLISIGLIASGQVPDNAVWVVPGFVTCSALAWQVQSMIRGIPMRVEDNDAMAKLMEQERKEQEENM